MTRLSRFVAVAVLLGGSTVGLSACSGASEPVASATPSPPVVSGSPSVSPTPTALSDEELLELIPESARAENFGSSVNFAAFFVKLYPELFNGGDPAIFAALSAPSCEFCASVLETYDTFVAEGNQYEGGEVVTSDLTTFTGGLQPDGTWLVAFQMEIAPSVTTAGDGTVIGETQGASLETGLSLQYVDGHWIVLGLNYQNSSA